MKRLNELQRTLLFLVFYFQGLTFSRAVREISKMLGIPESTIKWNLRKLRDQGYVICGNKEERYVPIKVSREGMKVLVGDRV